MFASHFVYFNAESLGLRFTALHFCMNFFTQKEICSLPRVALPAEGAKGKLLP
jgi:hypothetical protein